MRDWHVEMDVSELRKRLHAGEATYLLDVRQPEEHAFAALPNSVLIPLRELPCRLREIQPPAEALVVAYCHHGVRSLMAARFLRQHGIHAISLRGGIDAWSSQVDPTIPRYA